MAITTLSSRQFNQFASEAKRAANNGPVFITDRGKTAHVLLSFEDYQKIIHEKRNIANSLTLAIDIDFEPNQTSIKAKEVTF